jgi:mannose/fructose/N-acetylgalactosamine-specific phosphotransferase system component IID
MMYVVAIAWMFVVTLMSVVEAVASNGSILGAIMTFVFYGILPLGLVLYLLGTPLRRRHNQAKEAAEQDKDTGISWDLA